MWVCTESGPDWESSVLHFKVCLKSKVVLRLCQKFVSLFSPWARNNLEEKINRSAFLGLDQHYPIEHSTVMKCSMSVQSMMVLLATGGWLVSTRYVASATE